METGEILAIHSDLRAMNDSVVPIMVGHDGITEIQLRNIRGELSLVPYIYVYKGAQLWLEMPQSKIILEYGLKE